MLAGLGQFAIIVGARLRLVAAPPSTRLYVAPYDDLSVFMGDLLRLNDDGRFDTVRGFAVPDPAGGWTYSLEATSNFAPGSEPDDAELTGDLNFLPGQLSAQDLPYFDFLNRLAPVVEFLKQIGVWYFPHPWVDLFLPGDAAESFIADTLADLTADDVGQGPTGPSPSSSGWRSPDTGAGDLRAVSLNAARSKRTLGDGNKKCWLAPSTFLSLRNARPQELIAPDT